VGERVEESIMPGPQNSTFRLCKKGIAAQLLAGTGLGLVLAAPHARAAEEGTVSEVLITGSVIEGVQDPALSQLTQPLVETPQSISVVSAEELANRAVGDLNDALRSVPGISLGAGEFSWQGNTPIIRGFAARGDMFLDGMRDFGNYYRDAFNIQQLEVLQGPSSIFFGRGSTGGVINQSSKRPTMLDVSSLTLAAGSNETFRAVADVNKPLEALGEGSAARIVGMWHKSNVPGRDVAAFERFGVAPSLALGLGTPTRLRANYFHQSDRNVPDYGLPWYFGEGAPVPRNNFYGFESDFQNTEANVLTLRAEHDPDENVSFGAQIRYAHYGRDFRITEVVLDPATTLATPLDSVVLNRNIWSGDSVETALIAQADVTAEFMTGGLAHAVVVGIEGGSESSTPIFKNSLGVPNVGLLTPDPSQPFTSTNSFIRLSADTDATSFAVFAVDTIDLSAKWEATFGFRWDYFDVLYKGTNFSPDGTLISDARIPQTDKMPSYRAALLYKPRNNGTVYATFGTSFNPSAESLTQITSGRAFGTENANIDPEENQSFELGTKWEMLAEALTFNAAIFRIEKRNVRIPDLDNPGFNMLGGKHRVDGFQIQAVGHVTAPWMVSAGYTFLDSQVVTSVLGGAPVGSPLINTPEHSISLFTEYSFPSGFSMGGGARYQSERLAQNASTPVRRADGFWTFEAMAKYVFNENIQMQLNVYNLTDEYYLEQLHPWHVVPGAGRSAQLSVKFTY
jgi:catecholate siderophore receptor